MRTKTQVGTPFLLISVAAFQFIFLAFPSVVIADQAWDSAIIDPIAANLPRPSKVQYTWHEQERTMFVHLGVATWAGLEYDDTRQTFDIKRINPTNFNADQICNVAESWGAKMVLLVAKHCGGFCWWPTLTSEYCVRNIPWKNGKGNLVKDLANACRAHGLKMGIYLYPDDPKYMASIGRAGRTDDPSKQIEYNSLMAQQWKEVLTICGPDLVSEVWFDGGSILPLDDVIKAYAPNAAVFGSGDIRWAGNENGIIADPNWNTITPDGKTWLPVEADVPLYNHFWFWSPSHAKLYSRKIEELMKIYLNSVGHGGVMLLNASPDTNGHIAESDSILYKKLGETISLEFDHPLAQVYNKVGDTILVNLPFIQEVNTLDFWEEYKYGHRIRSYTVQAKVNGSWLSVAHGTAVGRRKIDIFKKVATDQIRISISEHVGIPMVQKIRVLKTSFSGAELPIDVSDVVTSSDHSAPYMPQFIHDNNFGTRWAASDSNHLAWIQYDFGRLRRISSTRISELSDRVRSFTIECRNGASDSWKVIYLGKSIGIDFSALFPPVTTRYVRLRVTDIKELSPTFWEWNLTDRIEEWEFAGKIIVPAANNSQDIDISIQIAEPRLYEVKIVGTPIYEALPIFENILGDPFLLKRTDFNKFILNRSQVVTASTSSGMRLKFGNSIQPKFIQVFVRPYSGTFDPNSSKEMEWKNSKKGISIFPIDPIYKIGFYDLTGKLSQSNQLNGQSDLIDFNPRSGVYFGRTSWMQRDSSSNNSNALKFLIVK